MAHPPKEKQLPDDIMEHDDHTLMEAIFGPQVMAAVDKVVAERSTEEEDQQLM